MARRVTNVRQFGQVAPGSKPAGNSGLLPSGARVGVNPPSGGAGVTQYTGSVSKGGTGSTTVNSRPSKRA